MDGLAGHLRRNIVAYVALFFALGGVSIAASDVLLNRDNVVRSRHIAPGEVRTSDLARGNVSKGKLSDGLRNAVDPQPPADGIYSGTGTIRSIEKNPGPIDAIFSVDFENGQITAFTVTDQSSDPVCNQQVTGGTFFKRNPWIYSADEPGTNDAFYANGEFVNEQSVSLTRIVDFGTDCELVTPVLLR